MKQHILSLITCCGLAIGLSSLPTLPSAAQQKSSSVPGVKRCTHYWNTHKTALRAAGKTKKDFMGSCLDGTWVFQ